MTQHIIDTDELEKLPKYDHETAGEWSGMLEKNDGDFIRIDDLRALIANSPQADGMVLDVINQCAKIAEKYEPEEKLDYIDYASKEIRKLLSTYKPQADDVRKDAEKYQQVKDILCHHEGLSMTLEYRKGDEKYANRKVFTETEIQANPFLIENIQANAGYLWNQIKQAIDKLRE